MSAAVSGFVMGKEEDCNLEDIFLGENNCIADIKLPFYRFHLGSVEGSQRKLRGFEYFILIDHWRREEILLLASCSFQRAIRF